MSSQNMSVDTETITAIMGAAVRKGAWEPAELVQVISIMGGVELDFRDAVMLDGVTEVEIRTIMGGVTIIVPDDIDVETEGMGIMGGFEHLGHISGDPDAPLLRITGFAIMGGVEIKLR
jgi:hypothetical protein